MKVIRTADGFDTLCHPELGVWYHSLNGALQESWRVFIELGWQTLPLDAELRVFEVGFGTGLNAFLTQMVAQRTSTSVQYWSVDTLPLMIDQAAALNYPTMLAAAFPTDILPDFLALHQTAWNQAVALSPDFLLYKMFQKIEDCVLPTGLDLVYFDAFAPSAQPELWTEAIFAKIHQAMRPGGILTTYCSKSQVQRNLRAAGFRVEKYPGPPRKREVLRAVREG